MAIFMLHKGLRATFLLLLAILQAYLLLAWKHVFSRCSTAFVEKTGVLGRICSMSLCCCHKLQFWILGRQDLVQMDFTREIMPFKLPLQPNNKKLKKYRKDISDAYISLGLYSRTYSFEDMQIKCFEPALWVKFTLLQK